MKEDYYMKATTVERIAVTMFKKGAMYAGATAQLLQEKSIWDFALKWLEIDKSKRDFFDNKIRGTILNERALNILLEMQPEQRNAIKRILREPEGDLYLETIHKIEKYNLKDISKKFWAMDPGDRNILGKILNDIELLKDIIEMDDDEKKVLLDILLHPEDYPEIWTKDYSD